eukprot:g41298.t1
MNDKVKPVARIFGPCELHGLVFLDPIFEQAHPGPTRENLGVYSCNLWLLYFCLARLFRSREPVLSQWPTMSDSTTATTKISSTEKQGEGTESSGKHNGSVKKENISNGSDLPAKDAVKKENDSAIKKENDTAVKKENNSVKKDPNKEEAKSKPEPKDGRESNPKPGSTKTKEMSTTKATPESKLKLSKPQTSNGKRKAPEKDGSDSSGSSDSSSSSSDEDEDVPLVNMKNKAQRSKPPPTKKAKTEVKKKSPGKPKPDSVKPKPDSVKKPVSKKQKKEESSSESSSSESESSDSDDSDDSDSSSSESESSDSDAKSKKRKRTGKKKTAPKARGVDLSHVHPFEDYETRECKRLNPINEANKWWNRPRAKKGAKWTTLEHNAVIFPPPYEPHNVKMKYDGEFVELTPEAEEVATFYAVMLETDYVKNPTFNKNFFKDWKKILGNDHIIQDFQKCDFRPIYDWAIARKEKKTAEKKADPSIAKKAKAEKEAIDDVYAYCLVDGYREKIANCRVEPPGLFRGRGKHPKTGMLKRRVKPEDIVINIGKGVPIPKPPDGHKWKGVIHNPDVTWLAFWRDNVNGDFKYIFLAPSSRFKGESDMRKYHVAAVLKTKIETIRKDYRKGMTSSSKLEQQRSTAMYLIDVLALRVGNEKDLSERADTVGCCSLRVEHIKFCEDDHIELDFLGKDSMRYYNKVKVDPQVYKNLQAFSRNKGADKDIFDQLNTSELNKHLSSLMPKLTAKVFRTYNASITLEAELKKQDVTPESMEAHKVLAYNKANREVAILCNHQKSVSKGHEGQMARMMEVQSNLENQIEMAKAHLKKGAKESKSKKFKEGEKEKEFKLPSGKDATQRLLDRLEQRLENHQAKIALKDDGKEVSLGTSKINYMDPRITVAWCKRLQCPIEKVFNKSLMDKFPWAMEVPGEWTFDPANTFPMDSAEDAEAVAAEDDDLEGGDEDAEDAEG